MLTVPDVDGSVEMADSHAVARRADRPGSCSITELFSELYVVVHDEQQTLARGRVPVEPIRALCQQHGSLGITGHLVLSHDGKLRRGADSIKTEQQQGGCQGSSSHHEERDNRKRNFLRSAPTGKMLDAVGFIQEFTFIRSEVRVGARLLQEKSAPEQCPIAVALAPLPGGLAEPESLALLVPTGVQQVDERLPV